MAVLAAVCHWPMLGLVIVTLTVPPRGQARSPLRPAVLPDPVPVSPRVSQIGPRRIHTVRVRGGNKKYRALRLDVGNFSWGSECE